MVDGDDVVGVALPPEAARGLDRERGHAGRQHVVAGTRRPAPRTGPTTASTRPGRRGRRPRAASRGADAHPHLGAGADQHDVEVAVRRSSTSTYAPRGTPSAARSAVPSSTGTFWRVRMSAVGPVAVDVDPPRLRGLVRVGRADQPEAGHRPHRRELLDRLVGRAVLAEADGVVRPDERDLVARRARRGAPPAACSR